MEGQAKLHENSGESSVDTGGIELEYERTEKIDEKREDLA